VLKAAIALALITGGSIGCCSAETRLLTDPEKRLIIAVYGANLKDSQSAR
jgi:hypothetical protein